MTSAAGVVIAVIWILSASAADGQSKLTISQVTVNSPDSTGLFPTDDLRMGRPTAGLFIGVSEYRAEANVVSTPAHSIAAALMQEAFYDAARESEMEQRRKLAEIAEPGRWARHQGKVTALKFSPDGALLASGGEDGKVVVGPWEHAGPTASVAGGSEVVDLSFARDSSRLLAAFSQGRTALWDPRQREPALELEWKGEVHSADLSPDGRNIAVTMDTGEIWLVAARSGAKPVRLQKGHGCKPFPRAVFSPDGEWVAGWDCRHVLMWPVKAPGHSVKAGAAKKFVRSLLFSPVNEKLIAAGDDGLSVWRIPGLAPEQLNTANSHDAVDLAVLSSDGRFLATLYEKGPVRVWDVGTSQQTGTMAWLAGHPLAAALARGGESLAGLTYSNWAWLAARSGPAALSVVTRPVSTDPVLAAKMRNAASIEGLGLPADVPTEATGAVALTADGRVLAAGYGNGEVALHPGVDARWNCSGTADRLSLVVDLSLPTKNAESSFTMAIFNRLHGTNGNYRLCRQRQRWLGEDGYHLGMNGPVSRERILNSLGQQIAEAEALLEREGSVFLVVYVAAHGELTEDGRAWILPADAKSGDRGTWIEYEAIAAPVRQFLERARASGKGPDAARALLVFDACQRGQENADGRVRTAGVKTAPGLVILESASPGQYAWHWIPEYRRTERFLGKTEGGKVSKEKTPDTVQEFRTRISILPIASQYVFSRLMEMTGEEVASGRREDGISLGDWIRGIMNVVPEIQRRIPEAGSEFRQDVRVLAEP